MKISVVIVTYNRLEKLKNALNKYEQQEFKQENIIVVNNASTDGTKEFLEKWEKRDISKRFVINLEENLGGAGGFYIGMEKAVKLDTEWIWLSDDDAYPRKDALLNLNNYYESLSVKEKNRIVALAGIVYYLGGNLQPGHRRSLELSKFKLRFSIPKEEDYNKIAFPINIFSYVGTLIKKDALLKVGLDEKDYFIYSDDAEHSIRLNKVGKIYCVPNSIVDHDTTKQAHKVIGWGTYYETRNTLLLIKKHFPKRYFWIKYLKGYISNVVLSSKSKKQKMLYKAAYSDALHDIKGIHSLYKPGWDIQE